VNEKIIAKGNSTPLPFTFSLLNFFVPVSVRVCLYSSALPKSKIGNQKSNCPFRPLPLVWQCHSAAVNRAAAK
jgi:hypothetical protein